MPGQNPLPPHDPYDDRPGYSRAAAEAAAKRHNPDDSRCEQHPHDQPADMMARCELCRDRQARESEFGRRLAEVQADIDRRERELDPEWRGNREGESQALPVVNDQPFIHELVMDDVRARMELGQRRYGTALQPYNNRSALRDTYEELLDVCVYMRQLIFEEENVPPWAERLLQSWLHNEDLDFKGVTVPAGVQARIRDLLTVKLPRPSELTGDGE